MSTPTADANLEGHSSNKIQHVETTKMMAQDINHTVGDKRALSLILAMGTIVENQSAYNTVSIDVVVDEDESLPIPNEVEGLIILRDALGHQTLWPKELILDESMVPKQPSSVECGYYVLGFMKEIIENPAILTEKFNGNTIYTQDEVDEVRLEWFEHVKLSIS
ncbi:hypothetical protein QYF36_002107 [Acer negundo]|nr:hypothetical protein QYF36_002107 [Acer negundo]